ncbi:MAG: hypothetical protein ACREUV_02620 [Burkholderiales bacterium]
MSLQPQVQRGGLAKQSRPFVFASASEAISISKTDCHGAGAPRNDGVNHFLARDLLLFNKRAGKRLTRAWLFSNFLFDPGLHKSRFFYVWRGIWLAAAVKP